MHPCPWSPKAEQYDDFTCSTRLFSLYSPTLTADWSSSSFSLSIRRPEWPLKKLYSLSKFKEASSLH